MKAAAAGNGVISDKTPRTTLAHADAILEKKCVAPGCTVKTSAPHSKLWNGDYLCCSACSKMYYAKANPLGAWGSPPPLLHVVS